MKQAKQTVDTETTAKQGAIVKQCGCPNAFQDERYGRGMRVFNLSGTKRGQSRCTSCGRS